MTSPITASEAEGSKISPITAPETEGSEISPVTAPEEAGAATPLNTASEGGGPVESQAAVAIQRYVMCGPGLRSARDELMAQTLTMQVVRSMSPGHRTQI